MARADVGTAAGADGPRLLHADEDRLRLVAATLARGGRFVLLVADAPLWPSALAFLREHVPDHTFVERAPTSSDEASRAISDPLRDTPGLTIVIRITGREAGPIEALNLRRESLVEAAANFLVVLEGDEAHKRFLQEAPDCYSYRHLLAVLEGEPEPRWKELVTLDETGLSAVLEKARNAATPKERAERLDVLASILLHLGEARRSQQLLEEAISVMAASKREQDLDEDERKLLAELYWGSSIGRSPAESYRRLRKARDLLQSIADRHLELFASIQGQMIDAIGFDPGVMQDAVEQARDGRGGVLERRLFFLALAYLARQDVVRAREAVAEIDAISPAVLPESSLAQLHFLLFSEEGAWGKAGESALVTENPKFAPLWPADPLNLLRARLLSRRGESRAARRIYESLPASVDKEVALAKLAAEAGQLREANSQLERMIDAPRPADGPNVDELLEMYAVLVYVTELEIAAGGPELTRAALDSRLAALRLHIERTEDPDPPWPLIRCLLLQADAYLKRSGAERLALQRAAEAWKLADEHAPVLASSAARRLAVASLRLGELDEAGGWLARGIARAREHEHRGDEAQLRGLALWHTTLADGDIGGAESAMRAAIAATGSVLVEASVLARSGTALGRRDLLQRAQQIYQSLPWPAREGACLEALGELRIAEARYRTFGLAARLAILERRSGPPPLTAVDDE